MKGYGLIARPSLKYFRDQEQNIIDATYFVKIDLILSNILPQTKNTRHCFARYKI